MRQPEQIARSWIQKAEAESDDFDKFVSLWFALNALYNEFFQGKERNAIKDFIDEKYKSTVSINKIKQMLSDSHVKFFQTRIIRDMRGSLNNNDLYRVDTTENARKLRSSAHPPIYRLKQLLMILYQVRCNLFHGDKMYAREQDKTVISNAARVLERFLIEYLP